MKPTGTPLAWRGFAFSTVAVAVATAAAWLIEALAPVPNISMVFLMAVLFAAVSFGLWPAIYASFLSFLAYNFFHIDPVYTLQVAELHELLALTVFLIVAIVTSVLAARLRAQTRERTAAQAAAETERVRNILLASVSHDFRTPLASILGSATSLIDYRDKLDAAAQEDLLRTIKTEAEALDGMVRNLLAMTRIDAGALEVRRDWIDLRDTVDRVVSATRRRGAAIAIDVRLPPDLPLIRADALLIEQALGNVVNNVVAHAGAGTRVTIDADVTDAAIALRVTDDGPGIAAVVLPRVFEKFSRAGKGDGTGLGLAIAKGIMAAHDGTIAAQSPLTGGCGTRITLTLPREPKP
jgi:two-component system, OmpR family, sensor histidine kinase KdpD